MMNVVLPPLGEGIEKATVSFWFIEEGEKVTEKDDLVELTTDKAIFNLPSPATGILSKITFHEGETVHPGEVLGAIDES